MLNFNCNVSILIGEVLVAMYSILIGEVLVAMYSILIEVLVAMYSILIEVLVAMYSTLIGGFRSTHSGSSGSDRGWCSPVGCRTAVNSPARVERRTSETVVTQHRFVALQQIRGMIKEVN